MFFKKLTILKFTAPVPSPEHLEENNLAPNKFARCNDSQLESTGWAPPQGETLAYSNSGSVLLRKVTEERILPGSVIRDLTNEKVRAIEEAVMRKLRRPEKDAIRTEILQDLIPRAFTQQRSTYGLIIPEASLLLIESTTESHVDGFTQLLRDSDIKLELYSPKTNDSIEDRLTEWLQNPVSAPAIIGDECELIEHKKDGAVVRCLREDITCDDITGLVHSGKKVKKLAFENWANMSFILTDDLELKKIKFSEQLLEDPSRENPEGIAAPFDADLALMIGELKAFVPSLIKAFGGEYDTDTELTRASQSQHDDPLYPEAVKLVTTSRNTLASHLQRHLRVGYNRACRLLEEMQRNDIVSCENELGHREVLAPEVAS